MKILLILLLSSCMNNTPTFFDKLLNDFDRYSLFISIKINSLEYSGRVIIENDDLFYYLNQTQKLDKEQYKKVIKEKLIKDGPLDIGKASLVKWNFIKVANIESVNKNAKKGLMNLLIPILTGKF